MATAPPRTAQAGVSTSDRLTPYVPRVAIEWLRETPNARHKQIEGSLAFVDISGFTALTERLSKKGKVGAEEMNDLLNDCFTELLSVAYDQGAGVIKWGGDAVLLLFDGDEHEARACRGALDMQRTMRSVGKLRTSSGLVTLRMSVGIHSGAFDFFLVGDLHRELVITGPGASATVEMEAVAEAGEVAISPSTAAAIEPRCLGEKKGPAILLRRAPKVSSERSSPIGDVADLDLAQLLPLDIREHLIAGGGEAEHRPMTPAFIHFMGADELLAEEGPDALADALDFVMRSVQRAAHDHQVAFFETDIAPSGGKVMLMAGAPRSSGNDEERMLRAMRAVLDAGSPLPLRIGVNWGRIFVGDFGPPYRRAYSVKGDSVNLAARLMAKAEPGQLLTTDDVLERSRTRFDALALEPFQAKGKEELVQAYVVGSPLGLKERSASAPLVGREDELAVLIEALDMARRYEGRIVELVAEPGMGKSRLIEELRATAEGVAVRSVQCEEYESATPYFTFRDLLRDLVGATGEQDSDAAERRLRLRVETSAPHLMPWLPLLGVPFGLELPDTPETALLGDEFRKSRLEEATRELLGMLLLEPTVLVFEDTHWMDDASADLLREADEGARAAALADRRHAARPALRFRRPRGGSAGRDRAPASRRGPGRRPRARGDGGAPVPAPRDRGPDGAGRRQSALSHRAAGRRSAGGRAGGAARLRRVADDGADRPPVSHRPPGAPLRRGDRDELREGPRGRGARAGRSRTGRMATVERVPRRGRRGAPPLPPRSRPRRRLRGSSLPAAARGPRPGRRDDRDAYGRQRRRRGRAALAALLPRPRIRQGVALLARCGRPRPVDPRERRG